MIIVSYRVDGYTQYGYVRYPREYTPEQSYPVLVMNHGGNAGHDLIAARSVGQGVTDQCTDQYFVVAANYRGEPLRAMINGTLRTFQSEGPSADTLEYWQTVFDGDVDV